MLRVATWRMYVAAAAVLVIDTGLGCVYHSNGRVEMWASRIGWTALIFSPVAVVVAYTIARQKWWQNNLGTALVWLCAAYLPFAIPLAWVFTFDNGMLTSTWLAWFFTSGPALSSLVLMLLAGIFLRIRKDHQVSGTRNTDHDGDA